MERWEHIFIDLDHRASQAKLHLNAYGDFGWELVAVVQRADGLEAFMKRSLTDDEATDDGVLALEHRGARRKVAGSEGSGASRG